MDFLTLGFFLGSAGGDGGGGTDGAGSPPAFGEAGFCESSGACCAMGSPPASCVSGAWPDDDEDEVLDSVRSCEGPSSTCKSALVVTIGTFVVTDKSMRFRVGLCSK